LLLGTGPQVDPGYEANLNIPLHNFTNDPVKIYLNKSFVSIDFVRTGYLALGAKTPNSRDEFLDEQNEEWKELRLKLCPQRLEKLSRKEIEDYVGEGHPSSSLGGFAPKFEESTRKIDEGLQKVKRRGYYNWSVIVALIIGFFAAVYTAYFHLDSKLESKEFAIRGDLQRLLAIEERQSIIIQDLQGVTEEQSQLSEIMIKEDIDNNLTKFKNVEDTISALNKRVEKLEKNVGSVD